MYATVRVSKYMVVCVCVHACVHVYEGNLPVLVLKHYANILFAFKDVQFVFVGNTGVLTLEVLHITRLKQYETFMYTVHARRQWHKHSVDKNMNFVRLKVLGGGANLRSRHDVTDVY